MTQKKHDDVGTVQFLSEVMGHKGFVAATIKATVNYAHGIPQSVYFDAASFYVNPEAARHLIKESRIEGIRSTHQIVAGFGEFLERTMEITFKDRGMKPESEAMIIRHYCPREDGKTRLHHVIENSHLQCYVETLCGAYGRAVNEALKPGATRVA